MTKKDVKLNWKEKKQKAFKRVEEEIYNKASLSNTRLGQENESRDRCIRFCYKRSIVDEV